MASDIKCTRALFGSLMDKLEEMEFRKVFSAAKLVDNYFWRFV